MASAWTAKKGVDTSQWIFPVGSALRAAACPEVLMAGQWPSTVMALSGDCTWRAARLPGRPLQGGAGSRYRLGAMSTIGPYALRNPFIMAPMAGVSEQPFRVLAFKMGAALCPTELVSAQGLMRANARTVKYLRHDPEVERPYSLQIFGGEPDVMARAAVIGQQ